MNSFKEKLGAFFGKKGLLSLAIQCAVAIILVVVLIVGTNIAFFFEPEINTVLAPAIPDSEELETATAEGQKMSARIMEEGTVLLRNENNALPLTDDEKKVNVFGWHVIDWLYGTGGDGVSSGGVLPEDDDFEKNIDLLKALNEYGVEYNEEITNMYQRYFKPFYLGRGLKVGKMTDAQKLVEPDINDKNYYSDALLKNAKEYSNVAIMVISRLCGEGAGNPKNQPKNGPKGETTDSTRHYLELSTEEEALLTYLGVNFEKVIVVINNCNQMELGLLETIPGIDACLYVGYTGTRGAVGIPKLLYGETSPSGKTVDTFAYDLYTNPNVFWTETNYASGGGNHLDRVAGIYIGYKWYETADVMGLWTAANGYEKGYEGVVQYPFGYGLSYTQFKWTVDDIKIDGVSVEEKSEFKKDSKIEFTVTVKNTGTVKGREVVQIYVTAPYTAGGIEKSSVELVAYGKTAELDPESSQTLTIAVDPYDFASYDCYDKNNDGFKGYQLDRGEYSFKLMTSSHEVNTVTYKNAERSGEFKFDLPATQSIENDPVTGQPVKNLFTGEDAIDIVPSDAKTADFDPEIPWLTRSSFPTPEALRKTYSTYRRQKSPELIGYDKTSYARWQEWDKATVSNFGEEVNQTKPTWGSGGDKKLAVNGILTDLGIKLGENYDDPDWQAVLDQVTFDEALTELNRYYGSAEIVSVGKPRLSDLDGPTQVKGYSTAPRGTGYPSMVVIAQTFNQDLAFEYGQSFGNDMKAVGVVGLWGFACDLHVNAFFGRNNESPAEDAFLSGTTMAKAVSGVNTRGRYTFLKHFAIYHSYVDQTYITEQAFRETHLKAFRKAFVDGGALGAMTSYQSIGAETSNYSEALTTGVLRREWQFKGAITTDASMGRDYQFEGLVRCGGNFGMNVALGATGMEYSVEKTTGRMQNRMREAVHEILYTWLRANYNERTYQETAKDKTYISSASINSWVWWKPFLISFDIVVGCVIAYWILCAVLGFVKLNKEENA